MYKARSRFLQRDKGRSGGRSARAAHKANERRAPFFYQIKKLSSEAKSDFPIWLQIEIREAGGTKGWIKKNAYWQKRLRQHYHSIIAFNSEERSLKKLIPKWLFEEVCSFGRVHWLKVHLVKGGEKDLRNPIEPSSVQPIKKDAPEHSEACRPPRRIIVGNPIKDILDHNEVKRRRKGKRKKDKSASTYKKDALNHAVSGGAFGMNRRRH